MNRTEAAATARTLAHLTIEAAPVSDERDFLSDDGETACWEVILWASEADAENDAGANALARVRFAECDPAGTVSRL